MTGKETTPETAIEYRLRSQLDESGGIDAPMKQESD